MDDKMKPSSTSTPDTVRISARRSVHDHNSYFSPISRSNDSPVTEESADDTSEEDLSSEERHSNKLSGLKGSSSQHSRSVCEKNSSSYHCTSEDSRQWKSTPEKLSQYSTSKEIHTSNTTYMWTSVIVVLIIIFLGVCVNLGSFSSGSVNRNISDLKVLFPSQSEDMWNSLESGVEDVKRLNKPSVFIIPYKPDTEETLNKMIEKITKYSSCILNNNCEIKPIVTSVRDFHTYTDYGCIITKYKNELENRAVMVVHNLDEIPGELAQAFHSMCDEYNPLVNRAVFFFTIRITDPTNKSDLQLVEEILKDKWSALEDDIFYPLFTRISNMVLNVAPEV